MPPGEHDAGHRARQEEEAASRAQDWARLERERAAGDAGRAGDHEEAARRHDDASVAHARAARDAHAEHARGQRRLERPTEHHAWVLDMLGTEPSEAFDRLAALAGRLLSSRVALVSLVEPEGQSFLGESGLASAGHVGVRGTSLDQSLCKTVISTAAPLVLDDAANDPRAGTEHGAVRDLGVRAYAGVPLQAAGETVGALCAIELQPRRWSESDIETLNDLAHLAEALLEARIALGRAEDLAERERASSELLQQTLQPDALPLMPRLSLAAAYRPAETIVGGDWYEVLRIGDGRCVAFALGDVVGHGLEAAAAATRLRSAFQAQLVADATPATTIARLNDLAGVRDGAAFSSLIVGRLDTETGDLEWAIAGHPPPVIVQSGFARLDEPSANPVLAALPANSVFSTRRTTLAPGDGVVLYSDGLVEERTGTPARYARLRDVCEQSWGDPQDVVDAALAALRPGEGPDDVAVLVLRRDA